MSLALDLARHVNPAMLAPAIGMEPDPWQDDVLRSNHPRILLNCCRQSGKSTVASVLAVHAAVYQPESLILLVSRAFRQSSEVFQKCLTLYRSLGRPVVAEAENALSLILENGSRIISLPGSSETLRGYSAVRLVVIDEASQVKDDLLPALLPMLGVSGGRLIALSTPAGKRGWWWDAWENGGPNWKRVRVPVDKCARIPPEAVEEARRVLVPRWFSQEYMCEFVEQEDQVFGTAAVQAAFSKELEPLTFELPVV